jgi:peptidoglycan DL-endopeptidase CwlO
MAAGGYLVYAGIRDVPLLEGLRELAGGKLPAGRAPKITSVGFSVGGATAGFAAGGAAAAGAGAGVNAAIATAALKYKGIRYVFGGHRPETGMDCSGFVTWVLVQDIGMRNLPSQVHTVVSQFAVWNGAATIPRDQCAAGDLVLYGLDHMGIALSNTQIIHAPQPGDVIRVQGIWGQPRIRRVLTPASRAADATKGM